MGGGGREGAGGFAWDSLLRSLPIDFSSLFVGFCFIIYCHDDFLVVLVPLVLVSGGLSLGNSRRVTCRWPQTPAPPLQEATAVQGKNSLTFSLNKSLGWRFINDESAGNLSEKIRWNQIWEKVGWRGRGGGKRRRKGGNVESIREL